MGPCAPPMTALQPAMPFVSQAPLQLATPFEAFSSSAPDVRKKKKRTTSSSSSSTSSMSTKELRRKLHRKEKHSRKHQSPAPHHKHHRKHADRKHRGRTSSPKRRSASHHAEGRKRSGQVSASRSQARPNSRKHHAHASYREHRHSSHHAQGRQRSGQVSHSRSRARPTRRVRMDSRSPRVPREKRDHYRIIGPATTRCLVAQPRGIATAVTPLPLLTWSSHQDPVPPYPTFQGHPPPTPQPAPTTLPCMTCRVHHRQPPAGSPRCQKTRGTHISCRSEGKATMLPGRLKGKRQLQLPILHSHQSCSRAAPRRTAQARRGGRRGTRGARP